jgi:hypothetical protein
MKNKKYICVVNTLCLVYIMHDHVQACVCVCVCVFMHMYVEILDPQLAVKKYVDFCNVCLNSYWWFMLCLLYISSPVLVLVYRDKDWLCWLGPTE